MRNKRHIRMSYGTIEKKRKETKRMYVENIIDNVFIDFNYHL